jgi:hypothetical protein
MPSNNYIYKMSNAGGFKSLTRYYDMLAGNTVWNPWEPQGAYDSLATVTVPSGGVASITFAGIPSTYKHLQIRATVRSTYAGSFYDYPRFQFNGDTGSNYARHLLYGDGASAAAGASTSDTKLAIGEVPAVGGLANTFGPFIVDILDFANTSKYKTARTLSGNEQNYTSSNRGIVHLYSGLWMNTAAINSIKFYCDSGNFAEYSSFALYGVK